MPEALLVEDSPVQALLVKRSLEAAGYAVTHVSTAEQALKACYSSPPDIVLQDQHLAEMSGLEVCRRIKADIVLSGIPVLALTAGNREQDHIAALDAGADAFLPKDSPGEQLLAVMARLIAIAAAQRPQSLSDEALGGSQRTRILIVDDSATFRMTLSKRLSESGFEIADAASGPEGLALLAEQSFDVAVADLVMPEMDGLAFCRRARRWAEEQQRHLGLLILTGSDREDVLVSALEAGADDYVGKLHEMDVILAHITAVSRRVARAKQVESINQRNGDSGCRLSPELEEQLAGSIQQILKAHEEISKSKLNGKQREQLNLIEESAAELDRLLRSSRSGEDVSVEATESPARDSAGFIDWDEVSRRVPAEVLQDISGMVLAECPQLVAQIGEGLDAGNADKVRLGAHTMKGSAAVLAADSVVEAASRLELMAKNQELTDGREALARLESEVGRLLEAIRARFATVG